MTPLCVRDLGLIDYQAAMDLQDEIVRQRVSELCSDTLLLLEHPPVVTLGRRAALADLRVAPEQLASRGIGLHHSTRGGLATYHGPGQLVGYPIVRPRALGLRLPEYVHGLERALIVALATIGVHAETRAEHVGVWTEAGKVAAVGVALRRGVTLHGFAVNLQPNLDHFSLIDPCGLADLGVTSAAVERGAPVDVATFKRAVADAFAREFGLRLAGWEPGDACDSPEVPGRAPSVTIQVTGGHCPGGPR